MPIDTAKRRSIPSKESIVGIVQTAILQEIDFADPPSDMMNTPWGQLHPTYDEMLAIIAEIEQTLEADDIVIAIDWQQYLNTSSGQAGAPPSWQNKTPNGLVDLVHGLVYRNVIENVLADIVRSRLNQADCSGILISMNNTWRQLGLSFEAVTRLLKYETSGPFGVRVGDDYGPHTHSAGFDPQVMDLTLASLVDYILRKRQEADERIRTALAAGRSLCTILADESGPD